MTFTPCPKPLPREPKERKAPNKISPKQLAKRGGRVFSTIAPKKDAKPIAKRNPERAAKRRVSYTEKLAAYKRSETYKLVEQRAGGCCERRFTFDGNPARCGNSRAIGNRLTHHHKTYARFGGKELPSDIELLCEWHNEEAESQHPTRNRSYQSARSGTQGKR